MFYHRKFVRPDEVYQPRLLTITLFHTWSLKCGNCHRDFVSFSILGAPKCPYCKRVNIPELEGIAY